ncbi:uncharacterized protein [Musca autumnalis]|uniref:uncharacterized protein n=1 Tax=Musca autumnalis TaxID=221902 RepID=UPI003CF1709E
MSESFYIKTEPFAKDIKQEQNSNHDTHSLSYNTTKLETFTNMGNYIKDDELDLDKMEEFLPENFDKSIIDIIKKEDMEEFLPEDATSIDSPSSLTWKSYERTEHVTKQHLTNTKTQQISLPKLEIIDVHTDEQDSKGDLEINGDTDFNISDSKESSVISSSRVVQTPTEHKCELCDSSHINEQSLRRHIANKHNSSIDTVYICEICNKRFTTAIGLALHYYQKHPETHSTQKPTEHKCEQCGLCYVAPRALRKHIKDKHSSSIDLEHICEICNQKFATQLGLKQHSYRIHRGAHSIIQHKCELCDSSYRNETSLSKHMRDKHPSSIDTEYICKICNQRFVKQKSLDRHSYWAHPETQIPAKHKCELCGRCYGEAVSLRDHIRKKHPSSINTEYICKICNLKFITQKGLDKHSYWKHPETHIPTEHKCELCDSFFADGRHLRAHIRSKHPTSIESEYICEMCNQRFTTKKGLALHYYHCTQTPTEDK